MEHLLLGGKDSLRVEYESLSTATFTKEEQEATALTSGHSQPHVLLGLGLPQDSSRSESPEHTAHPYCARAGDVRRCVQRCLCLSLCTITKPSLSYHAGGFAVSAKVRICLGISILPSCRFCFRTASLGRLFIVSVPHVKEICTQATSCTTPPASLILRSASLLKYRARTMSGTSGIRPLPRTLLYPSESRSRTGAVSFLVPARYFSRCSRGTSDQSYVR